MTFNSNTVVDPVAKYGGRRCRGWPLLAKHFGVEVRATAVVDRCGVGDEKQPCGFDVEAPGRGPVSFVCATAVERDGWVRALGRVCRVATP